MTSRAAMCSIVLSLVAGCSTTTVDVTPGTSQADGGSTSVSKVCSTIAVLTCATSQDTCSRDLDNALSSCTGGDDAKQALLSCLASAHYDCSAGEPTTHDCASQVAAASCSSVPHTSADAGVPDGGSLADADRVTAPDAGQTTNGICGGLCQNGVPSTYGCTSSQGSFDVQINVGASDCPNYAKVGTAVCASTTMSIMNFMNTEIDCDGTVRTTGSEFCSAVGSWSLVGSTLSIDFTAQGVSATCTRK